MKTVGHRARVLFSKNDVEHTHPPLPTILILFGYFHIFTNQVLKL